MLILDGTIPTDVAVLLHRINTETDVRDITLYSQWLSEQTSHGNNHHLPKGIVYMRVAPTIAIARIQKRALAEEISITDEFIKELHATQEQLFIEKKNIQCSLKELPVLVLNGNIDFQTDFGQFYNHLFYIKKFLKDIQEKEEAAMGIIKEKPHRRCC